MVNGSEVDPYRAIDVVALVLSHPDLFDGRAIATERAAKMMNNLMRIKEVLISLLSNEVNGKVCEVPELIRQILHLTIAMCEV